jgi:predicted nucleic acid-binding protein
MYLLDTNVISELRKSADGRINKGVQSWAEAIFPELMFISAITVLELEIGVLQIERRDKK